MLILPQRLGERLRWYRERRGVRQCDLARRVEIPQSRLCAIEMGDRQATEMEVERLAAGLGVSVPKLLFGTDWGLSNRSVLNSSRMELEKRFIGQVLRGRWDYEVPRDRKYRVRLRAARRTFPEVTRELEAAIEAREDYDVVRLLLRDLSCDSADEALVSLRSFAESARPAAVAPLHLGFDHHSVIDPLSHRVVGHCCVPAFIIEIQGLECVFVPQVYVKTEKDSYRLDFLVGVRVGRNVEWVVVEVDADGHSSRGDRERDAALHLPVIRLSTADILAPRFFPALAQRIRNAIWLEVRLAA